MKRKIPCALFCAFLAALPVFAEVEIYTERAPAIPPTLQGHLVALDYEETSVLCSFGR